LEILSVTNRRGIAIITEPKSRSILREAAFCIAVGQRIELSDLPKVFIGIDELPGAEH
jgi:hypothetical protein